MKKIKGNKKILISLIVLLSLFFVGIISIGVKHQKEITSEINNINTTFETFNNEKRDAQVEIYKETLKRYKDEKRKRLLEEAKSTSNEMYSILISQYDKTIKDNTIADVSKSKEDKLKTSKDSLNKLKTQIKDEDILNEEHSKDYNDKIDALVSKYETKLKEIEKVRKEKEEVTKASNKSTSQANSNVSSNNSSGNNGYSQPYDYDSCMKINGYISGGEQWTNDENGNKIESSVQRTCEYNGKMWYDKNAPVYKPGEFDDNHLDWLS